MTTRAEATAAAGACIAEGLLLRDSLPVEEAARLAYTPTGPSIPELEDRIRAARTSRTAPSPAAHRGDTSPAGLRGGAAGRGARTTRRSA